MNDHYDLILEAFSWQECIAQDDTKRDALFLSIVHELDVTSSLSDVIEHLVKAKIKTRSVVDNYVMKVYATYLSGSVGLFKRFEEPNMTSLLEMAEVEAGEGKDFPNSGMGKATLILVRELERHTYIESYKHLIKKVTGHSVEDYDSAIWEYAQTLEDDAEPSGSVIMMAATRILDAKSKQAA